mmetsp:Transcript_28032/g.54513  ORF Transcript_28032/g.54513 Transcript_28032/m.54513 type:complete len:110 (-) Transcript_28032:446-775(-)
MLRRVLRSARRAPALRARLFSMDSHQRIFGMEAKLQDFGADSINIKDTSGGCGAFFNIHVVSAKFEGMPPVKRQREIHKLLHEFIHDVHGISLKCLTPSQYEKEKKEDA